MALGSGAFIHISIGSLSDADAAPHHTHDFSVADLPILVGRHHSCEVRIDEDDIQPGGAFTEVRRVEASVAFAEQELCRTKGKDASILPLLSTCFPRS